ncbi:MAG: hypothetical protein A3H28_05080 [Acidobacteria bacterium RIFCSPLOWO2_02_FULL_61_28]|nr:MAG: hypothetical protein A3H28_05080 [Acidobacteria bacterium RIFCSPLOWO2_02_FULL_61_28]
MEHYDPRRGNLPIGVEHSNCARKTDGVSRRRFVTSLAAFGASMVLPSGGSRAQTVPRGSGNQPNRPNRPNRIDVHHHTLPTPYLRSQRERILSSVDSARIPQVLGWTPARAVEEMDKYGVATAITSIGGPGIWLGDVPASRSLARACNEYSAQMVRDHPGRFGLFAALPLPDPEGSLREIEYALDTLQADGFILLTSYGDKWPGDPAYAPVFEELNRRKAVVFFHPAAPACCRNLIPGIPPVVTEFLFDTTRAITSLLFSGSFARFPDIRFIFTHAGGTMPVLASRIEGYIEQHPEILRRLPNGVPYELKKLHYDVANAVNPSSMAALMNLVPASQILFGCDFPFYPIGLTAGRLDDYGLSAADRQAIHRDNATRLFPRLKG